MEKIPTLFKRDPNDMRSVTEEVDPRCQWVLDGEGLATRKYDGTCVMFDEHGDWWARREVKPGKTPPPNYQAISTDPNTGKIMGWEPIEQSPFAKAFSEVDTDYMEPGTYELCGPKINGNPEGFEKHTLIKHSEAEKFETDGRPQSFDTINDLILTHHLAFNMEGVVWHHPDGRMAKLKARDLRYRLPS